jgi:hypothetical protein
MCCWFEDCVSVMLNSREKFKLHQSGLRGTYQVKVQEDAINSDSSAEN